MLLFRLNVAVRRRHSATHRSGIGTTELLLSLDVDADIYVHSDLLYGALRISTLHQYYSVLEKKELITDLILRRGLFRPVEQHMPPLPLWMF